MRPLPRQITLRRLMAVVALAALALIAPGAWRRWSECRREAALYAGNAGSSDRMARWAERFAVALEDPATTEFRSFGATMPPVPVTGALATAEFFDPAEDGDQRQRQAGYLRDLAVLERAKALRAGRLSRRFASESYRFWKGPPKWSAADFE